MLAGHTLLPHQLFNIHTLDVSFQTNFKSEKVLKTKKIPAYAVHPAVTVAKHVPAAVQVIAHPHVHAHAPAVVVAAPAPAASYTAATRGAVHQAPLEGHAVSQTSLNLAPAPGTV